MISAEHLLNITSIVSHAHACNKTLINPIENYFRIEQKQIFYYFEFSPSIAFIGKVLNIMSTFLWSFMDLFLMITSIGLTAKFQQINMNLMKHKGKVSRYTTCLSIN